MLLFLSGILSARSSPATAVRQWREAHERTILEEFVGLLRIPNTGQNAAAMRRNATAVARLFNRCGVNTQLLEVPDAPPVVYGELPVPNATQTLMFYAHYDGESVNPAKWHSGNPFRPTLMSGAIKSGGQPIPLPQPGWPTDPEWRLYARSAGDDKAAIIALATALDALQHRGIALHSNLKFFIEGEQESGSPHLAQVLREHRDLLGSDVWFFCNGRIYPNRQQLIAFGARGLAGLDLTVYGARQELDSGQYGNWAPNPAMELAGLLASMKAADGKVLIDGFYDDILPLSEAERRAIAEAPNLDETLKRQFWLGSTEGGGRTLLEAINLPSLNIRGFVSGAVGDQARNVIPATATTSLDIRLVKGMDHRVTLDRIISHIRRQGFHVTETEPGEQMRRLYAEVCKIRSRDGYNAVRTPMDSELSQRVIAAVEGARGPIVKLPTLGNSLPLHCFEDVLGAPVIIVPIANHDDNQHSHDENIRLQNLWDGIETMAALMTLDSPPAVTRTSTARRRPRH